MSLLGKQFPNITVDAISEMGDNLRINVLEEAIKNNKKVVLFWAARAPRTGTPPNHPRCLREGRRAQKNLDNLLQKRGGGPRPPAFLA